jgi:phospholipid/cholesterol/gamma-HCH transport system substrate-binding protein
VIKQAPSIGRILTMVAFALSCFGILIFLWLSFGGSVPLQPQGYRINAKFPEATQLAQEAEVRISGVKVGKVRRVEPDETSGLTDAVLEIDARYAPLAKDTRATLRQKTLLGETFVELAPGSNASGQIPDGGDLPTGQVAETVELDEILRTFDPETRERFSTWLDQQGRAALGNGEAINDAIGNLTPFAENTGDVLKVLRVQSGATRRLIRNTGVVFGALSERQGQLRSLIRNSNEVWEPPPAATPSWPTPSGSCPRSCGRAAPPRPASRSSPTTRTRSSTSFARRPASFRPPSRTWMRSRRT